MRLKNRNFVVTGAGRGIGAAIARALAREGANLALISRSAVPLDGVVTELRDQFSHLKIIRFAMDVSDEGAVHSAFDATQKELGPISGLINNAAIFEAGPMEDVSLATFRSLFKVNVDGVFLCAREFVRRWSGAPADAVMVNISSIAGIEGAEKFPGLSAYSATKSAVIGLSETWAAELRPKKIRVNVVAPGATDTDMLHKAFPEMKANLMPSDIADRVMALVLDTKANNKIVVVPN